MFQFTSAQICRVTIKGNMPKIQPKEFVVYLATNIVNGKRYLGATSRGLKVRRYKHFQDAKANRPGYRVFNSAIRKYGEGAFEWRIISTASSFEEMMEEEIRLIAK